MTKESGDETADYTAEDVGPRLKTQLSARGLSVRQLWVLAGKQGSERHLHNIVNGKACPRPDMLNRLLDALDLDLDEFLGEDPFVEEVTVLITEAELDTLYAAASFDRLPLKAMVRQAVAEHVATLRSDPDVERVLKAILAGRASRRDP